MEAWYHPFDCMNDPQPEGHMASYIRRRTFLATLLGGAAAWPLVARAQQGERMRRIGMLMAMTADNPESAPRLAAFAQVSSNRVGLSVKTSVSITAGATAMLTACANTRRNWSLSPQMSSWPIRAQPS